MLPDVTLMEAVSALRQVSHMPPSQRLPVLRRIVHYFFINPVEMTACPFLEDRKCVIYPHRFFGCRAYGLWSPSHYREISARDREGKTRVHHQWEKLGVLLPPEIISFRQPYCTDIRVTGGASIDDGRLESVSAGIDTLSADFSPWHRPFEHIYSSDLSFLLTATIMGIPEAVRSKLDVVKTVLSTGNHEKLDLIISDLPDIFDLPYTGAADGGRRYAQMTGNHGRRDRR